MPIPTLTNLVVNPSFEVNTTNWSAANGTLSRVSSGQATAGAWVGSFVSTVAERGYVAIATMPVVAGKTYTASLSLKMQVTASDYNMRLYWYTGGALQSSSNQVTTAAQLSGTAFTRISSTLQAPAGIDGVRIEISSVSTLPVGSGYQVDGAMLTESSTLLPYFDGTTAADTTYTYAWTGTAHASTSIADPKPYLDATLDQVAARVSVNLDWSNSTPVPATALVERVSADGTVAPVRGADPATLVAGQWVGDDFEAPLDQDFYYQASSTSVPGTILTSPTYQLSSGGSTWLKHPGRPLLNLKIRPTRGPDLSRPIEQGVFDVLGRSRPIATSMLRQSERGELALYTATDAERQALLVLVQDGAPLFLSTPAAYGIGSVYISIGEVTEQRLTSYGKEPGRYWSLPFTVVDRPSGGALAAGNSWSDALGAYPSWSQLLATEGTWLDLAEGID